MGFLILIMIITFWLISKNSDQGGSGWDYLRFPLVDPYYAIKIDDENGWVIPLHIDQSKRNFWYYLDIKDVTKIAVENGIILVNSAYSKPIEVEAGGKTKELHWFIIIPNKSETGYETEEMFNLDLQQYGINQPNWQEPLTIIQTFDKTGCLEWIQRCK